MKRKKVNKNSNKNQCLYAMKGNSSKNTSKNSNIIYKFIPLKIIIHVITHL